MTKAIVAKKFNNIGSKVFIVNDIEESLKMFKFLSSESIETDVQVVTVNGLENYKEYYPIEEYTDSKKFAIDVLSMMQ